MPVNELHQSHYLGERLFDSSQGQAATLKRAIDITDLSNLWNR